MTAWLAATVLLLEAFLVFFGVLGAHQLTDVPTGLLWGGGLGLAALCVVVSGVVRRPGGVAAGWVVQVLLLACGFVLPAMFVVGGVFVVLWWYMLRLGGRVERDRAAFVETWGHPDTWPRPDEEADPDRSRPDGRDPQQGGAAGASH